MDIQQRKSWKVLLIGDHCLDVYHYGICNRLSPEAPVPVLKQVKVETKMGMSSNVALNLRSFGIKVNHQKNGDIIKKHRLIDSRFQQHLLRFDEGENTILDEISIKRVKHINKIDAVVISDYNKGFLRHKSIKEICEIFKDYPIFVDTKKQDLSCFTGCYLKVNEKEFKNIKKFPNKSQFIVTLGEKGALYENKTYPVNKTEVFDVCGAGDVFLSALVYGYLKNGDIDSAIPFANKCAAFSVSKMGTYVLSKEDIDDLCI
tara:strand:+ start:79 stop:858 length:780 start_codon:yes stop_codon:yes gene_type:complete